MDSASGQSWPATTVGVTGINSPGGTINDLAGADRIDAIAIWMPSVHSRGPAILDRNLVKHLIDFASPADGTAPTVPPQRQTDIRSTHVTHSSQWIAMCALFAAPTVSVVVRILLWTLGVGRGGTGW
jgi:hypothetical protein